MYQIEYYHRPLWSYWIWIFRKLCPKMNSHYSSHYSVFWSHTKALWEKKIKVIICWQIVTTSLIVLGMFMKVSERSKWIILLRSFQSDLFAWSVLVSVWSEQFKEKFTQNEFWCKKCETLESWMKKKTIFWKLNLSAIFLECCIIHEMLQKTRMQRSNTACLQ